MASYASFPVCHPARPKRIGSGNRRLGNPSASNTHSKSRDSKQLLPVGRAELSPTSARQNQQTTPRPEWRLVKGGHRLMLFS